MPPKFENIQKSTGIKRRGLLNSCHPVTSELEKYKGRVPNRAPFISDLPKEEGR